ncbi:MAG TPA: glycosyltransferase [Chitinophagaceae bacterium]|nr:glycosyltransferase [Chitinophagaceae bacterium]
MHSPVVSVCTVTYNHEHFIRQCLEGIVMQQTNFKFEAVIGEDCSTDGTGAVVREFEAKYPCIIKPCYHKKNMGPVQNMFLSCFPRLSGKYVAICDGDDMWTDTAKLQKQVDFLEANNEFSFCFHRANRVEGGKITDMLAPLDKMIVYKPHDIFHISIPTSTVVFRNYIKEIPRELLKVKSGDTFLFGMLSSYGGAVDMGFPGANYRIHNGGIYSGISRFKQYKQAVYTRKMMKNSPAFTEEQKIEISKEIKKRKKLYSKHFVKKGQFKNALQILFT